MNAIAPIGLVDAAAVENYPISHQDRLNTHFYVEMHYHRWLTSDSRLLADLDVRSVMLDLYFLAQDQLPVGTLPTDERILAKLVGVDLSQWKSLCQREVGPLHKWKQCLCDGEVRLMHPVVLEIAQKALTSKKKNSEKSANDRFRKRMGTIAGNLKRMPGMARFADSPQMVEQISVWLDENYPGGSATEFRVKEAVEALSS